MGSFVPFVFVFVLLAMVFESNDSSKESDS